MIFTEAWIESRRIFSRYKKQNGDEGTPLREFHLERECHSKGNRLLYTYLEKMALEYMRKYRTYFHISQNYGLSESVCYRACQGIEDALIKSGKFPLLGKKDFLKSDIDYEVILIDASETTNGLKKVR